MPTEKFPSACDDPIQTWFQSRAVRLNLVGCPAVNTCLHRTSSQRVAPFVRDIEVKLDPRIAELSPPFVQREHLTLPANQ
jgi:hypothetical protein